MRREYRKQLENNLDHEDKIYLSNALDIIDIIEDEVDTIKDMLEEFTNLTEIKEIYKLLEDLSEKLY